MSRQKLGVLLVEDDEDDYILVRDLLAESKQAEYQLRWVAGRPEARLALADPSYDICLLDYRLGEADGLELLREATGASCRMPIIVLTGYGDREVDERALEAGAVDFLSKADLTPALLDRSIRYAVRQAQILENLRASEGRSRQLSVDLLSVQENERRRIAGELHDSVGQALAAAKFTVENGLQEMRRGSTAEAQSTLERVVAMLRSIAEETRRIQNDLQPRMLEDLGLLETLSWFCQEHQKTFAGIRIECSFTVREEDVPGGLKATVFRIVQESFNNIVRHSGADRVKLALGSDGGGLALVIRDNGQGFDPQELAIRRTGSGMGLQNLKGRTELSGGTFFLDTATGKGTALLFQWPAPQMALPP
jgi:signal transduction histidine kinase